MKRYAAGGKRARRTKHEIYSEENADIFRDKLERVTMLLPSLVVVFSYPCFRVSLPLSLEEEEEEEEEEEGKPARFHYVCN